MTTYEANLSLADLRDNPFAWPGGYPIVAIMDDGESLCSKCINDSEVHEGGEPDGWRYEGSAIYWEGEPLICAHCYTEIESAYGI